MQAIKLGWISISGCACRRFGTQQKQREEITSISMRRANGAYVNDKWTKQHHNIIKAAASDPRTARILFSGAKVQMCKDEKGDRAWLNKVRPWWGHHYHFHVRLSCPAGATNCKNQAPPSPGDGCKCRALGARYIEPAPKSQCTKTETQTTLTLARLPQQCVGVLQSN